MGALKNTAGESLDTLDKKFDSIIEAAVGLPEKVKGAVDNLAGHEPEKHTRRAYVSGSR